MSTNSGQFPSKLKNKSLALFFTPGVSLKSWHDIGMIDREVALYNKLSVHLNHIYLITYGGQEDMELKNYLNNNITIVPKKYVSNYLLYSILLPFIHHKILNEVDILKTNQMTASWSALLTKATFGNKLVIRTGYMASINAMKSKQNILKRGFLKILERVSYKFADGIITSSQTNMDYINKNYIPSGIHIRIPNYIETSVFKPMYNNKKKGSICFVGRLSGEKNLFSLFDALRGLPYDLTVIGSGPLRPELEEYVNLEGINVRFLGNLPNHELPEILSQHEIFILPSLYENMPKTLLEAMACGLPVIGTNVKGINEVIEHEKNGLLCETDPSSIRESILTLLNDEDLKQRIGENARKTIVEQYSLDKLAEKELNLLKDLV